MKTVAVVSQKGGSGKTTISGHLAVQAERAGDGPVAIIDTDPQGSLSAWWNAREAEAPLFMQSHLPDLEENLKEMLYAGIKLVVIDTPPAITESIEEVIRLSDHMIIPTKPSPHDLRAVGATVRLIQKRNKPMVFVVNDASVRARITYEAAVALSQHGTVAPVTLHHRINYASSMIDGRTVMELDPEGGSALEIHALWEYVKARLEFEVSPMAFHHGFGNSKPAMVSSPAVKAANAVVDDAAVATLHPPRKAFGRRRAAS